MGKKVGELNIETDDVELTHGKNVSSINNITTIENDSRQNVPESKLILVLSRDKISNEYKSYLKSGAFSERNSESRNSENNIKEKSSAHNEFIQTTYNDGIRDNKNNESEKMINENDAKSMSSGRLCSIKSDPEDTKCIFSYDSFNGKTYKRVIKNESEKLLNENNPKSIKNGELRSIKSEQEYTKCVYSHDSRVGTIKVCDIRMMIDEKLSIEQYNEIFSDNLFDMKNYVQLPRIFNAVKIQTHLKK